MSRASEVAVSTVRVTTMNSSVTVTAEPGRHTVVADGHQIEVDESTVTIDSANKRVDLRVPDGVDLLIGTMTGRVTVRGSVGAAAVVTTSGRVEIDDARSIDVRTESGRVTVGRTVGSARVLTTSGRVEIDESGAVDVTTRSGRIVLGDVNGAARAHCASGKIEITMAHAHDVDAETISGRISISLPQGTRARITGPSAESLGDAGDHDCVVTARSGSGRVDVVTR